MPARVLEMPSGQGSEWDELYTARDDEVAEYRPYFTGDVFHDVLIADASGTATQADVMLVQHPCALRTNGVDLVSRVPVARVSKSDLLSSWTGHYRRMPLPALYPGRDGAESHAAAGFDQLELVSEQQLAGHRIACLTQYGVCLLLQRWVHHNSRVVVPTFTLDRIIAGPFAEAELIEEWCFRRLLDEGTVRSQTKECVDWLRGPYDEKETRQDALRHARKRSVVQKQMLKEIAERHTKFVENDS